MAFAFVEQVAPPVQRGYKIPERYSPVFPTQLYPDLNVVFMKHGAHATGHPRVGGGQKLSLQFGELGRPFEIERRFTKGQNGTSYEYKLSLDCGSKKSHKSDTTELITRIWYIRKDAPIERFVRTVRKERKTGIVSIDKVTIDKPVEEEKSLLTILKNIRS
jgi:hypothetical protein